MNTNPTEDLEDLKTLDYPVKIEYDDEDAFFVADFPDLPGCSATGSTVAEAYDRAQTAKAEWLRVTLEQGLRIPEPSKARDYSGRILLRLPVSLHANLADRARTNGASLNQYIVHLLSAAAVGDEVSSKLEAVAERLQDIELRLTLFTKPRSGMSPRGIEQPELLGSQIPSYQLDALFRPLPSSARESETII